MMFACQHSFAFHCTLTQHDCMSVSSKLNSSSRGGLFPCSPPKLDVSEERDEMKSSQGEFLAGDCGASHQPAFLEILVREASSGNHLGKWQQMDLGSQTSCLSNICWCWKYPERHTRLKNETNESARGRRANQDKLATTTYILTITRDEKVAQQKSCQIESRDHSVSESSLSPIRAGHVLNFWVLNSQFCSNHGYF